MAVVMMVVGAILFVVTLVNPGSGGSTPEWVWLVRALVAVVMGVIAATLSISAWRQAQRSRV
jgi:type IV secretory pathway VirB2 component (pilin)